MFEYLIDIAKNNPNISQIELNFVEGNFRARALYEKMGFRIVSYIPDAVKLSSGKLVNEYIMIKKINE
jgi:RimJ/RimL family protein N-acetyltransferase